MMSDDLAFAPVTELSHLVRQKKVSPVELTELYLDRLKRFGSRLLAVITLTEELALQQAKEAEQEIVRGRYRGPLHGIPWGAKDLLDTKGIRTTWGIKHHENRVPAEDATVVRKLRDAGAVLLAKLSMGELASGAKWYGGTTRCPWDPTRSSSGSSAGPGATTAAGLVGFSIGTETLGSIVSPSSVNGVTGLRPTYGRVSRAGAMALSWTMDKIGPMCRSVEDCAIVFDVLRGPDLRDPTAVDVPHRFDRDSPLRELRVGVVDEDFDAVTNEKVKPVMAEARRAIESLGVSLKSIKLPDYPYQAVTSMLGVEAAVALEDLIVGGHLETLVNEGRGAWKNTLPVNRLTPAVHYLKAMQMRSMMQADAARIMQDIDVWVAPGVGPASPVEPPTPPTPPPADSNRPRPKTLSLTNLTGQPTVCVPCGFVDGLPVGLQFVSRNFDEASALRLAFAYQEATGWHLKHPALT